MRHRPALSLSLRRGRLCLGVVCLGLAMAACGDDDPSTGPTTAPEIEGLVIEDGQTNDHTDDPVDYALRPPSGGDHAPAWLNCGFYDVAVPDENAVHALEHGVVWLAHDPALGAAQVETLRALYDLEPDRIIVSPYPGVDADVVAVAWGRRLEADGVEDPRLVAFVDEFVNGAQSPEPRAPCTGGIGADQLDA